MSERVRLTPQRLTSVDEMSPEDQAAFWARVRARRELNLKLTTEAAARLGGKAGDYFVVKDVAYPTNHETKDCPYKPDQCGYCHKSCDDENCGICEDRALTIHAPPGWWKDED